MKLGSLFSGGGLGDFGFMAAGFDIRWQVEIDDYCQKILDLRYPESKKFTDIKTLKGEDLEPVDIITGGFPCQPFSVAGKQKGKDDNRYLWPEMLRVIKECRPRWVVGENVPGITSVFQYDVSSCMEGKEYYSQKEAESCIEGVRERTGENSLYVVMDDLEKIGYDVLPIIFPSHALGAWHKRDRLWLICHAKHVGQPSSKDTRGIETGSGSSKTKQEQASEPSGSSEQYAPLADTSRTGRRSGEKSSIEGQETSYRSEVMANSSNTGIEGMCERKKSTIKDVPNSKCFVQSGQGEYGQSFNQEKNCNRETNRVINDCQEWRRYWQFEPAVGRVANGITDRVHRLKMLGNGQVPACTYVIGQMIMDIETTS